MQISDVSDTPLNKMKSHTIRRLAADILDCGKNKVWLDPEETLQFKACTSRDKVRELIQGNVIVQRPNAVHSRYHTRKRRAEVAKGRHRGPGKVHGPKTCLDPPKKKWIARIREMRATLERMREECYITPTEHRKLYMQAKGNLFKNNKVLIEYIEKKKADEKRMKELSEQAAAIKMRSRGA
ncbi:hypothetical protein EDEG_01426 [Edhazardia aedis USNM 41457]|uniref:Large ribosomal subunit protein eL19 domain-containing protein n=1 Tax=Edhazardia aedis (strain USNM 41457) TaxID=1003232 RepID=J9DSJ8_EDHAE|nr:hypothetical protein EDEG_01426 [Edhazardia aedis USNM 41457]|eukprot:EJW04302.1 hypothetical protein EDEG_01426 [Edhazardia aedis USNM 41457]